MVGDMDATADMYNIIVIMNKPKPSGTSVITLGDHWSYIKLQVTRELIGLLLITAILASYTVL